MSERAKQEATERCRHVERQRHAFNPGHHVVGGISVGQCEREALPLMVFCEFHAGPEAMGMVIRQLAKEVKP